MLRGIEPRSPGFHSGAYNPFCQSTNLFATDFLTDLLFPHYRIHLFQTIFLPSPAEDSNFLLSICSRMHTAMSASRTFAESIPIYIGMHRINDDGVAGHYITSLSTLQIFLRRERDSNPRTCYSQLFSRQLPRTNRTLSIV